MNEIEKLFIIQDMNIKVQTYLPSCYSNAKDPPEIRIYKKFNDASEGLKDTIIEYYTKEIGQLLSSSKQKMRYKLSMNS